MSIQKAEAIAEDELASVVRSAALDKGEWLPAMTFLERRHPDRWGRGDRHKAANQTTINQDIKIVVIDSESKDMANYVLSGGLTDKKQLKEGESDAD